jgi:23S rRNA-/tRNA-specific pseudouridylate synthase
MRKIQAADRASKTNVNIDDHLRTVYSDDHIVVTDKPSGILCVPGVNKNRSLLDLVFEVYGNGDPDAYVGKEQSTSFPRDSMIVHRLDMDTSGIVIFARTRASMAKLHEAFRDRAGAKKVYEALLVGWLDINQWIEYAEMSSSDAINSGDIASDTDQIVLSTETSSLGGGEIRLPLQRDHRHPPFMRVSTPESESEAQQAVKDLNHAGYSKLIAKKPKPSTTQFRILSHEHWMGHPVTRVALVSWRIFIFKPLYSF